ncbi:unnamed protein product [Auanema sp. JU1783]|nr:unnamed protein product [Auanema sp. JU1783]
MSDVSSRLFISIFSSIISFVLSRSIALNSNIAIDDHSHIIRTKLGIIHGIKQEFEGQRVNAFLGVPYAHPPIGTRRFALPEMIEPWKGEFEAKKLAKTCYLTIDDLFPQFPGAEMWNPPNTISEDCLNMNIWVPEDHDGSVIVWIYGGGFFSGSPSLELYDGRVLAAKKRSIVVNINYRLGPFGFLYFGDDTKVPGNMGLLDQQIALKWIHLHIDSFGGDPNRVTLFGESAGSASVTAHLAAPDSYTFFQKIIASSGSIINTWASRTPEAMKELSLRLAKRLNCTDSNTTNMIRCLQAVSDAALQKEADQVGYDIGLPMTFAFVPISSDKNFFKGDVFDRLRRRDIKKDVSAIMGTVRDEGTYWLPYYMSSNQFGFKFNHTISADDTHNKALITRQQYKQSMEAFMPYFGNSQLVKNALMNAYQYVSESPDPSEQLRDGVGRFLGDHFFTCSLIEFADIIADTIDGSVFMYYFTFRSSANPWPKWMGVMHGYEIEYAFGQPFWRSHLYDHDRLNVEQSFSQFIMNLWTDFTAKGSPASFWPKYNRLDRKALEIGEKSVKGEHRIVVDIHGSYCRLIEEGKSVAGSASDCRARRVEGSLLRSPSSSSSQSIAVRLINESLNMAGIAIYLLLCGSILAVNAGGGYQGGYAPGVGHAVPVGFNPGGGAIQTCGPAGCDFNPALLAGSQRGYPGIRARLNSRSFQYASTLVGDLLNSEIKKARIPPISQCIPQVQGCVQIYNLYVSRYRCPQRVALYPAAPNRLILRVENVDIGVTGNLGGQIVVLLPIALTGIVQLNIHQATITVDLAIERGPNGPYVRVNSCNVQIGYADAYIENGGLIGDIVNSQFRSQISGMVRKMIPGQVCGQIPSIVNEKLNSRLSGLPQTIGVSQMLSMFGGALGLGGGAPQPSPQYCQTQCSARPVVIPSVSQQSIPPPQSLPAQAPQQALPQYVPNNGAAPAPQIPTGAYLGPQKRVYAHGVYSTNQGPVHIQQLTPLRASTSSLVRSYRSAAQAPHPVVYVPHSRAKRQAVQKQIVHSAIQTVLPHTRVVRGHTSQYQQPVYQPQPQLGAGPRYPPPPAVLTAPAPALVPAPNLCARCPGVGSAGTEDPVSFIRQLAAHLDMSKLNDLYLGVQLLNAYATSNDFTVDLTGEFSVNGQGGTPFGPFPTQFPGAYDNHMAEFIVTDYTINSLFYWMHRKAFLTFRIGPDTPKIGSLLKTTCSDDEDSLEATEVELDEEEESRRLRRKVILSAAQTLRIRRHPHDKRKRRQDDGGLADLGICFGDILPTVREKYPDKKIAIQVRTVRAPSVILSQAKGGTATLELLADADIYIDGTNTRVGTITIAATVVVVAQVNGNRISGSAEITQLKLTDRTGTLGLPQDALDNLGNLGKELLQKLANDALGKGIVLNIPSGGLGGLPINIINPSFRIIEHGLYIATDMTISPSLLGSIGGSCR